MTRTIIIDGDVVVYKVAEAVAESFEMSTEEDDEYIYRNIGWCSKKQAKDVLYEMIEKIIDSCKGTCCVICLSDMSSNFRKKLNPNYKGNRKSIKPILYEYLRKFMQNNFPVYVKPNLEADDVIGILATSEKVIKGDKVVWSLDKDFKTIPCKFHRAGVKGDKSEVITKEAADWWFMYQTLIGDRVDGYSGCPNIGDKRARKILGKIGENPIYVMWQSVIDTYKAAGLTEEDALMNARMARILRAEDWDFKKKEVKLWNL